MSSIEKLNIYVPAEIAKKLKNDALLFEIYKTDRRTVNFNRFLSMLLCGYFGLYAEENNRTYDLLIEKMSFTSLKENEKQELAESILKNVILPTIPRKKGAKHVRLSLKPTKETEALIYSITSSPIAGDDSVSQYFCRMLMAYCEKPFSERERIVFRENYTILQDACRKCQAVSFITIWNNKEVRRVIPYCLATGEEEMFNYLLCEETNPITGCKRPATFRLNRITRLRKSLETKTISEETKKLCDRMKETAPQYVINYNEEEICVKLTDRGEMNFNRIYYGRPKPFNIEDEEDGHYYYFRCSITQAFNYFKRFSATMMQIISPASLQDRLILFYKENISITKHFTK